MHAASQKRGASVLLKHGADATAQEEVGWTPLYLASFKRVADLLSEHDADVTAQDDSGSTPLDETLFAVIACVFESGADADANAQDNDESTPPCIGCSRVRLSPRDVSKSRRSCPITGRTRQPGGCYCIWHFPGVIRGSHASFSRAAPIQMPKHRTVKPHLTPGNRRVASPVELI